MKILIICHYYPPLQSIASLRPYAYAKYWSEMGHKVTVLTTEKSSIGDPLPITEAHIVEQKFLGSRLIKAIKNSPTIDGRKSYGNENSINRHVLKKIISWLRYNFGILGAERIPEVIFGWYFPGKSYIKQHIDEFDVVVAQYSPPTALILGSYAKYLAGKKIKFVMDYRDSWTANNYSQPGFPGIRWIEKVVEARIIKNADLICCAQAGIAKEFLDRGISNVVVVENGYFDDIQEEEDINFFTGISLVYTGSFGSYRNIDFLQKALEIIELRDPELFSKINIFILGNGESDVTHPKIKFLGKVDYAKSLQYQKNASILFIVESSEIVAKYNVPGKFFEYLRYKKPIIAFGPKESFEIARYLRELRIGVVSDATPLAAANAICHVLSDLTPYSGANLEAFTRKVKSQELLAQIERISNS